jgi:hypothetical protein
MHSLNLIEKSALLHAAVPVLGVVALFSGRR